MKMKALICSNTVKVAVAAMLESQLLPPLKMARFTISTIDTLMQMMN
jgi:hypothetical protein